MEVFIMNITEIIKGIDYTIEGLNQIKDALMAEETPVADATPVKSKSQAKKEVKEEAVEETSEATVMTGKFDVEELKAMKYNEFKKLAATLGVKCTGTRDEIMERILALDVTVDATDEEVAEDVAEEEAVEEKPAKKESKSDKPAKGKKLGKKETDEPARDEFDEQAEAIAKETPVEDIIEALADVEVKATKKNAVEKLAYALREGLIEMEDDEEDEEEEDEEVTEDVADEDDDEEEISADSYFSEYDPNGFNDPEEMTEERKEAIEEKMDEILTNISEGKLKMDEIESYLEDNCTEEEIELLGDDYDDDEVIKLYMEMIKRTISDEGEEVEPAEPYEIGEHNMCCGHELKYVKKTKNYVCSQCGGEYEAE